MFPQQFYVCQICLWRQNFVESSAEDQWVWPDLKNSNPMSATVQPLGVSAASVLTEWEQSFALRLSSYSHGREHSDISWTSLWSGRLCGAGECTYHTMIVSWYGFGHILQSKEFLRPWTRSTSRRTVKMRTNLCAVSTITTSHTSASTVLPHDHAQRRMLEEWLHMLLKTNHTPADHK